MTVPKTDPSNPGIALPPNRIKEPGYPEPIVDPDVDVPPDEEPENEEPETEPSRAYEAQQEHARIDPSKIFAPHGLGLVWTQRK